MSQFEKVTLTKNGGFKFLDPKSKLIEKLLSDGWKDAGDKKDAENTTEPKKPGRPKKDAE